MTITFLLLLLFSACGQQKSALKGTIEEMDGVTIVKNLKEPIYGEDAISLEEELSIGEAEGREEYMFSELADVAVDEKGIIYALDETECHIKFFDKNGKYLMTISKEGQGPGELDCPIWISITYQSELMVEDLGNRSLSFFTLDGRYTKSLSTAKIFLAIGKMNSNGNIIIMSYNFVPPDRIWKLNMYDSEMNPLRTLVSFSDLMDSRGEERAFRPVLRLQITKDDNILYGYAETYELKIIDTEGKLIERILKKYEPVAVTQEEKEEYIKENGEEFKYIFPKHYPAYRWFILDEEDRIYVQTYEKTEDGKGYYHDIFDSKGEDATLCLLLKSLFPPQRQLNLPFLEGKTLFFPFLQKTRLLNAL